MLLESIFKRDSLFFTTYQREKGTEKLLQKLLSGDLYYRLKNWIDMSESIFDLIERNNEKGRRISKKDAKNISKIVIIINVFHHSFLNIWRILKKRFCDKIFKLYKKMIEYKKCIFYERDRRYIYLKNWLENICCFYSLYIQFFIIESTIFYWALQWNQLYI